MDFVVIGLGLGALALLGGLALLCLVAPRWQRRARAAALPADAAYPAAKADERHAAGQALLVAGAALLLATLGGISANLHDRAGAFLIASVATVAALGLLAWDVVYRRQHPTPPRRRLAPRAAPVAAASAPAGAQRVRRAPSAQPQAAAGTTGTAGAAPASVPSTDADVAAVSRDDSGEAPATEPEGADPPEATGLEATGPVSAVEPVAARSPEQAGPPTPVGDPAATAGASSAPTAPAASPEAPGNAPVSQPAPARIIDITARNGRQAGPLPAPTTTQEPAPVPAPVKATPAAADTRNNPEPDAGDDRVLALFPTAAARRERPATPPDDDGER
ncbi:MAG: hypothetical protein QM692_02860 [Thermomicrobiales bacterium]